jgi:uncharacterized membrane protein
MDLVMVVLRIVHIVAGVLWVGGAALFFFYIEPTLNSLGPDAEKFMNEMVNRRKVPIYFVIASTLVVVFGLILYWRDSNGLQGAWVTSPAGLAFGLGGLAALIAWLGGNLLIPRTIGQLVAVTTEMKTAGGPPSDELMARLHAVQHRLHNVGLVDIVLLGIAVVAMASARYL